MKETWCLKIYSLQGKCNLINLKPLGRFLMPLKKCFRDGNMAQCMKMLATNSGDLSSLFRTNKRGES